MMYSNLARLLSPLLLLLQPGNCNGVGAESKEKSLQTRSPPDLNGIQHVYVISSRPPTKVFREGLNPDRAKPSRYYDSQHVEIGQYQGESGIDTIVAHTQLRGAIKSIRERMGEEKWHGTSRLYAYEMKPGPDVVSLGPSADDASDILVYTSLRSWPPSQIVRSSGLSRSSRFGMTKEEKDLDGLISLMKWSNKAGWEERPSRMRSDEYEARRRSRYRAGFRGESPFVYLAGAAAAPTPDPSTVVYIVSDQKPLKTFTSGIAAMVSGPGQANKRAAHFEVAWQPGHYVPLYRFVVAHRVKENAIMAFMYHNSELYQLRHGLWIYEVHNRNIAAIPSNWVTTTKTGDALYSSDRVRCTSETFDGVSRAAHLPVSLRLLSVRPNGDITRLMNSLVWITLAERKDTSIDDDSAESYDMDNDALAVQSTSWKSEKAEQIAVEQEPGRPRQPVSHEFPPPAKRARSGPLSEPDRSTAFSSPRKLSSDEANGMFYKVLEHGPQGDVSGELSHHKDNNHLSLFTGDHVRNPVPELSNEDVEAFLEQFPTPAVDVEYQYDINDPLIFMMGEIPDSPLPDFTNEELIEMVAGLPIRDDDMDEFSEEEPGSPATSLSWEKSSSDSPDQDDWKAPLATETKDLAKDDFHKERPSPRRFEEIDFGDLTTDEALYNLFKGSPASTAFQPDGSGQKPAQGSNKLEAKSKQANNKLMMMAGLSKGEKTTHDLLSDEKLMNKLQQLPSIPKEDPMKPQSKGEKAGRHRGSQRDKCCPAGRASALKKRNCMPCGPGMRGRRNRKPSPSHWEDKAGRPKKGVRMASTKLQRLADKKTIQEFKMLAEKLEIPRAEISMPRLRQNLKSSSTGGQAWTVRWAVPAALTAATLPLYILDVVQVFQSNTSTGVERAAVVTAMVPFLGCSTKLAADVEKGATDALTTATTALCFVADVLLFTPLMPFAIVLLFSQGILQSIPLLQKGRVQSQRDQEWKRRYQEIVGYYDSEEWSSKMEKWFSAEIVDITFAVAKMRGRLAAGEATARSSSGNLTAEDQGKIQAAVSPTYEATEQMLCASIQRSKRQLHKEVPGKDWLLDQAEKLNDAFIHKYIMRARRAILTGWRQRRFLVPSTSTTLQIQGLNAEQHKRMMMEILPIVDHLKSVPAQVEVEEFAARIQSLTRQAVKLPSECNCPASLEEIESIINEGTRESIQRLENTVLCAASKRYKDVVWKLTYWLIDPNDRDEKGNTALMIASAKGYQDIVQLLLQSGKGARVNDQALEAVKRILWIPGWVLLHNVDGFLRRKAQVKLAVRNHAGDTALSLAERNGHDGIAKLLKEASG